MRVLNVRAVGVALVGGFGHVALCWHLGDTSIAALVLAVGPAAVGVAVAWAAAGRPEPLVLGSATFVAAAITGLAVFVDDGRWAEGEGAIITSWIIGTGLLSLWLTAAVIGVWRRFRDGSFRRPSRRRVLLLVGLLIALAAGVAYASRESEAPEEVVPEGPPCANRAPAGSNAGGPRSWLVVWSDCVWDKPGAFAVRPSGGRLRRLASLDAIPSPDGRWLVTTNSFGLDPDDTDIVVRPVDHGPWVRLTLDSRRDWEPTWSPDGRFIAFQSFGSCEEPDGTITASCVGGSIMVVPRQGGTARRVAETCAGTAAPDWSPDGEWIVYSNCSTAGQLMLVHPDGSGLRDVVSTTATHESSPVWSQDGRRIAFGCGDGFFADICVVRADGTELLRLTAGNQEMEPSPRWSPDGQWIAYARDHGPGPDVWMVRSRGGGRRAVVATRGLDYPEDWLDHRP